MDASEANDADAAFQNVMQAAVEAAPIGVLVCDEGGIIRFVNRRLESSFGYPRKELIGQTVDLLVPEPLRTRHALERAQYVGSPESRPMGGGRVLYGRRKDGTEFPVEIGLSPVPAGRSRRILATIMDVTARQQAQDALRQSEANLRIFVESSPTAVAMFDRRMRYIIASRRWAEDYGLDRRDLTGLSHYDVFPEIPQRWKDLHQQGLAGETLRCDEDPFVRKDGRLDWIRWEIVPWRVANGDVGGIILFTEVITPRREQEQALRQNEAELRLITDHVPALIARLDANRRYRFVNKRFEELLGAAQGDVIGKHVKDVWGPEAYAKVEPYIDTVLAGEPVNFETEVPVPGTSAHWINFSYFPEVSTSGRTVGYYVLAQDITEKKRADRLEESNAALQHFAAIASHDLQSPLRRILSFAQLISEDSGSSLAPPVRQYVNKILKSAERMYELIEALLANARVDTSPEIEEVALNTVLSEVLADLEDKIHAAGAEITSDALPMVRANRAQLYQLLLNLISNAIKYRRDISPVIHISSRQESEEWVVGIADNGLGIPNSEVSGIFEMFRRLHRYSDIPGSGIGLSTCQKIVRAHGGRLWVDSVHGKGSTFYFSLPHRRSDDPLPLPSRS